MKSLLPVGIALYLLAISTLGCFGQIVVDDHYFDRLESAINRANRNDLFGDLLLEYRYLVIAENTQEIYNEGLEVTGVIESGDAFVILDINSHGEEYWLQIITDGNQHGQVRLTNALYSLPQYYGRRVVAGYENGNTKFQNSFLNAKAVELEFLDSQEWIHRIGPVLEIGIGNYRKVFIDRVGTWGPFYSFAGIYNDRTYILHEQYFEGHNFAYIDLIDQAEIRFHSRPKEYWNGQYLLSVSPFHSGHYKVKMGMVSEAGISEVFEITLENTSSPMTSLASVDFSSNDKILLIFDSIFDDEELQIEIAKNGEVWTLQED